MVPVSIRDWFLFCFAFQGQHPRGLQNHLPQATYSHNWLRKLLSRNNWPKRGHQSTQIGSVYTIIGKCLKMGFLFCLTATHTPEPGQPNLRGAFCTVGNSWESGQQVYFSRVNDSLCQEGDFFFKHIVFTERAKEACVCVGGGEKVQFLLSLKMCSAGLVFRPNTMCPCTSSNVPSWYLLGVQPMRRFLWQP